MFLEQWKDTAFGSDYGGDFLEFLESFNDEVLSLELLYAKSDLRKFLTDSEAVIRNKDFNVQLKYNQGFEQTVHYEEAIIALSAVVIESLLQGSANMKEAYGTKILKFDATANELMLLKKALTSIYQNFSSFNLFDMLDKETKEVVLNDIFEMMVQIDKLIK